MSTGGTFIASTQWNMKSLRAKKSHSGKHDSRVNKEPALTDEKRFISKLGDQDDAECGHESVNEAAGGAEVHGADFLQLGVVAFDMVGLLVVAADFGRDGCCSRLTHLLGGLDGLDLRGASGHLQEEEE